MSCLLQTKEEKVRHINPYKVFEAIEFINYNKFNKDQSYRHSISSTILKKVKTEMKDEILEFFYTLIDDIPQEGTSEDTGNDWCYNILQNFYHVNRSSTSNVLTKGNKNFIIRVSINLVDFNTLTIMSEVKSIVSKIIDSGYHCEYNFTHKVNGKDNKESQSLNVYFDIRVNGDDILPRIGVDISKIKE